MTKPVHSAKTPPSIWAMALLLASSLFALASAALLSADVLPVW